MFSKQFKERYQDLSEEKKESKNYGNEQHENLSEDEKQMLDEYTKKFISKNKIDSQIKTY